jgi:hypothetical protein
MFRAKNQTGKNDATAATASVAPPAAAGDPMPLLIHALVAGARRRPEFAVLGLFFCAGAALFFLTGAADDVSQQQVTMVIVGTISVLVLVGAFVVQKGPLRVIIPVFLCLFLTGGLISMFYEGGVTAAVADLSEFIRETPDTGLRGATQDEATLLPMPEASPRADPKSAVPALDAGKVTPKPSSLPVKEPRHPNGGVVPGCTDFEQNVRLQGRPGGTKRISVELKGGVPSCSPDACPRAIAALSSAGRWPNKCPAVVILSE